MHKICRREHPCERQHRRYTGGMEAGTEKILNGHQRYRMGLDDVGAFESDQGNKQADPGTHSVFEGHRDGGDDFFADGTGGKQEKYHPFHHHGKERDLPGVTHHPDYGVGKKCVQTHRRSQSQRIVGKQRHSERTQRRRERSYIKKPAAIHTGAAENGRVHRQNIGYCQKHNNAGINFTSCRGLIFLQFEKTIQKLHIGYPIVFVV